MASSITLNDPISLMHFCEHDPGILHSSISTQVPFFCSSKLKQEANRTGHYQLRVLSSNNCTTADYRVAHLPASAITIKTGWCINTNLLTAAIFVFTFVASALVAWFVLPSGTVHLFITNFAQWDTHATTTVKLSFVVTSFSRSG